MPLTLPQSVNYPSPLVAQPAIWNRAPREGARTIGVEVDWSSMGGSEHCVAFNAAINQPQTISQIVALTVDNSQCGADITFIFPDTGTTLDIPAYEAGTYPVFTNAVQFYLSSPQAQSVDKTTFTIHNAMPPPVDIPKSTFQSVVSSVNQAIAAGTTQLITATVTGSLEALAVHYWVNSATAWGSSFFIEDGSANVLWKDFSAGAAGQTFDVSPVALSNISLRFAGGLKLVISGGNQPVNGWIAVNTIYRAP